MNLNTRNAINYLLLPIALVFYLLSLIRKTLYRIGLLSIHNFNLPVIVVGNITVGGSGKTPIVMALVEHFKQKGMQVGVVSRGYGGTHTQGSLLVNKDTNAVLSGDEPLLIATQTDARVMVNKNRVQAVNDLINQHKIDIVISDDGLQHYAMSRTVEIVVINGKWRFGNGLFLPAGPLRESTARLKNVDFVINNGAQRIGEYTSKLTPKSFINLSTGVVRPLDFFNNTTCYGVAGISHPENFFDALSALGVLVDPYAFSDHYNFTAKDLNFVNDYPIIMSAKDCVKCSPFATQNMWYLHCEADLDVDFLTQLDDKL